jgi:hypothetical protein
MLIWMPPQSSLLVSFLDFLLSGVLSYSKHFVEVLSLRFFKLNLTFVNFLSQSCEARLYFLGLVVHPTSFFKLFHVKINVSFFDVSLAVLRV